jgi:hypothetical protein
VAGGEPRLKETRLVWIKQGNGVQGIGNVKLLLGNNVH